MLTRSPLSFLMLNHPTRGSGFGFEEKERIRQNYPDPATLYRYMVCVLYLDFYLSRIVVSLDALDIR